MKICYIANSRFPSERAHMTQIVQMCNAFAENDATVTLLVTSRKTPITATPEEFFGVPIRFGVERVAVPDIAGRAPRIPVPMRPFLFMMQRVVYAFQAYRHMRLVPYDVVYGRDEWVLWLLLIAGVKEVVWESHEARYSFAARRLLKKKIPLVAISEGIKEFYIEKSIPSDRVLVAHDAVDERFFASHVPRDTARAFLGIHSKKPVALYVGGLEAWKGVEALCVASKGQNIFETYVIGGKEREIASMQQQYPHIHFLGSYPYKDLPVVQQAADVLVIPNSAKDIVSLLYTSPLKLFAYMTAKKPIVASRIPSITNVLSDTDAFFFEADDASALQHAIVNVLQSPDEAEKSAENVYTKSMTHTWNMRAGEICTFIQSVT